MTTNTFTSPFTGDIVQPTDVSYQELTFSTNQVLAWPSYVPPNTDVIPASRIIDCFPTAGALNISLPPGGQGSLGTDILFVNKSSYTFTVSDSSQDQSVTLTPGAARYFYLIDNSTEDGSWNNFAYGVGTSSADAASLAGAGLTNILGKLATSINSILVSVAPTLTETSRASSYVWTGGAATITVPTGNSVSSGWYFLFRNNGTGSVSVSTPGIATINGLPSVLFNPGDSGIIICDTNTGNYFTVGLAPSNQATFSSATYDVDSIPGSNLDLTSYAPTIQTYVALSGTRTTDLEVDLPAITALYVFVNDTNQSLYQVSFKISGSSQPAIPIGAGNTGLVLSDGNNLYLLTQVGTGSFFAANGSASSPSFSFNTDSHTGMYLLSSSQLGITANSTRMLLINNSNVLSPQISTPATFNAGLIGGGTF